MNKKKSIIKKLALTIVGIILFSGVMLVLNHTAKNGRETTEVVPQVVDSPVYVECEKGKPVTVDLQAESDITISGIQLLLVNLSEDSQGTFQVTISNEAGENLVQQILPIATITPGEWFTVPAEAQFVTGSKYQLQFLADESTPYFMQVSAEAQNVFPFSMTVEKNNQPVDTGISFGINTVKPVAVTFGEILYFSVPFSVILLITAMIYLWIGAKKVSLFVEKLRIRDFIQRFGNDIFIVLLFCSLILGIYLYSYQGGVYITADSTGYMREAVNLVNGNGFHYDGMAGYHSWFANWPIIYPAMIAFVMLLTGTNAYLASKIVTIIMIGLILLVLRLYYKKDAWIYALCATNIGFVSLSYYTWSEIPFMFFLLCFSFILATIIKQSAPEKKWYILLGIFGLLCFLTRYFGIYIWIVVGVYILFLFLQYCKNHDKAVFIKTISLTITSFISGMMGIGYLLINKIMNGKASGVSRGLWWDDYQILTNDLIETLLKEIFNIFSLQIPQVIDSLPYELKVLFLLTILLLAVTAIRKSCRHLSESSVLIMMSVFYYLIFIAIRYRSSMDTFYFRFFEPASFLLCIALITLLLPTLRKGNLIHYLAIVVTVILSLTVCFRIGNCVTGSSQLYYDSLTEQWDEAYQEIPQKSVIIFNDIDFRASYYRPDVVEGSVTPQDTFESLQQLYYGSDYLCIQVEYAKEMIEYGEYDSSVTTKLQDSLSRSTDDAKYLVIEL